MADVDYIAKGDKTVNGQYRFVSHDAVTSKLHPFLVKHGICIIPDVHTMTQEGNRTIVNLMIHFINVDEPKDRFSISHYGYGVDTGDKGPGKAVSYAFKYAMLKTFCLETGDDPDSDAEARYEAPRCLEFDFKLPEDMTDKERVKLNKFLEYSADCMKKDVEEVKREALNRMPEFLEAFKRWNPKK